MNSDEIEGINDMILVVLKFCRASSLANQDKLEIFQPFFELRNISDPADTYPPKQMKFARSIHKQTSNFQLTRLCITGTM